MSPVRTTLILVVSLSSCSSIYSYAPTEPVIDGGIEAGEPSDTDSNVTDARGDVVLLCEGETDNTPCENPAIDCQGQCVCCGGTCQRCALPNRRGSCGDGTCRSLKCLTGWADCDDNPDCETDITTDENCGSCRNAIDPDVDANNCGGCGRSCEGGECANGSCQPVIIAESTPYTDYHAMALFGDDIYLSECGMSGRIVKVAKTAIATFQPVVSGVCALNIAVDADGIFWVEFDQIWRADHAGIQTYTLGEGSLFALDTSWLYFVSEPNVYQTSKDVSDQKEIIAAAGDILAIVADSGDLYLRRKVATQGQILHWSPASPLAELHTFEGSYGDLIIEGDYLYYSASSEGKIYRLNRQGPPNPVLVHSAPSSPGHLAADAVHLYWSDRDDPFEVDKVWRKKRFDPSGVFKEFWTGSEPNQQVSKILVDDTRIFILVYGHGTLPSKLVKQIKPL